MIRSINKVMAPAMRGIRLMVGRGVLALVNDAAKMQTVQVKLLDGEVRDMERFQNYGFTSYPQVGAEVAAVFVGGNRDHGLVLAIDDRRFRLKALQAGEVALYDDQGAVIKLSRTGIVINGGGHAINISGAAQVNVTGGDVIADGISLKTHKHGGVTAGGAQTGIPV
ncbi:phage baseplate assembly protein V [Methylobacter sp. Wu1]|uniref:phage baseplate assembly protein V n=1 Tax=Methylobacter sp. Wu1 TaxID=3119359 RepID=UPI002F93472A